MLTKVSISTLFMIYIFSSSVGIISTNGKTLQDNDCLENSLIVECQDEELENEQDQDDDISAIGPWSPPNVCHNDEGLVGPECPPIPSCGDSEGEVGPECPPIPSCGGSDGKVGPECPTETQTDYTSYIDFSKWDIPYEWDTSYEWDIPTP